MGPPQPAWIDHANVPGRSGADARRRSLLRGHPGWPDPAGEHCRQVVRDLHLRRVAQRHETVGRWLFTGRRCAAWPGARGPRQRPFRVSADARSLTRFSGFERSAGDRRRRRVVYRPRANRPSRPVRARLSLAPGRLALRAGAIAQPQRAADQRRRLGTLCGGDAGQQRVASTTDHHLPAHQGRPLRKFLRTDRARRHPHRPPRLAVGVPAGCRCGMGAQPQG